MGDSGGACRLTFLTSCRHVQIYSNTKIVTMKSFDDSETLLGCILDFKNKIEVGSFSAGSDRHWLHPSFLPKAGFFNLISPVCKACQHAAIVVTDWSSFIEHFMLLITHSHRLSPSFKGGLNIVIILLNQYFCVGDLEEMYFVS